MKGHVGGGSGFGRLQGVFYSVKVKSFHVLICFMYMCRNGSLKWLFVGWVYAWLMDGYINLRV